MINIRQRYICVWLFWARYVRTTVTQNTAVKKIEEGYFEYGNFKFEKG